MPAASASRAPLMVHRALSYMRPAKRPGINNNWASRAADQHSIVAQFAGAGTVQVLWGRLGKSDRLGCKHPLDPCKSQQNLSPDDTNLPTLLVSVYFHSSPQFSHTVFFGYICLKISYLNELDLFVKPPLCMFTATRNRRRLNAESRRQRNRDRRWKRKVLSPRGPALRLKRQADVPAHDGYQPVTPLLSP